MKIEGREERKREETNPRRLRTTAPLHKGAGARLLIELLKGD